MEQEQVQTIFKSKWFSRLKDDISDMVEREKEELLRIKHEMGNRILQAKKESGMDEKAWSGALGDILAKLAEETGYDVRSFYDALRLVQKAPTFSQLRKMTVERTVMVEGKEMIEKVPVVELSWDDVKRSVLYPAPPNQVQTQRPKTACIFKSEDCGGDVKNVDICGRHMGDFVVWMNERKLKIESTL